MIDKKTAERIEKHLQFSNLCIPFSPQIRLRTFKGTNLKVLSKTAFKRLLRDKEIQVKGGNSRCPSFIFYKTVKHGDIEVEVPILKLF